jgi:hypothetical protein
MPRPASIAWRRSILTGDDEIWIATTNSVGSIIGYWLEVPDPVFQAPQWNVQHIAGPGSANFAQAPRIAAAPAIAFDPFPSARGGRRAHVAASGPNGVFLLRGVRQTWGAMVQSKRRWRDWFRGCHYSNARRLCVHTHSLFRRGADWLVRGVSR